VNALLQPALWRRRMTVRDLDAVMSVEIQAYSFAWSRGNFIDSLAAGYLAEVLLSTEGLVGYFVAMPGVDEMHLLNLTVAPDWQGQGHGRALLHAVQDHARERDLPTLLLEVRESNQRALDLYRGQGFAEVGRRRGYYPAAGRREDAVVMSRVLRDGGSRGDDGLD
jgi:ribosomal-protein-alanine N-acetyltransferase